MDQQRLGKQGLIVSAMGLGCMGMSDAYGPADEAESIATVRRAHAVHPISVVQTEYSLWSRDPEDESTAMCVCIDESVDDLLSRSGWSC